MRKSRIYSPQAGIWLVLTLLLIGLAGCGSEAPEIPVDFDVESTESTPADGSDGPIEVIVEGPKPPDADSMAPKPEPPEASSARSAENLAQTAIAALVEAFEALVPTLEKRAAAASVREVWIPIRDKARASMEEIAHHRTGLDAKAREELRKLVMERRPQALKAIYAEVLLAVDRYREADVKLAEELAVAHDLILIALHDPPK